MTVREGDYRGYRIRIHTLFDFVICNKLCNFFINFLFLIFQLLKSIIQSISLLFAHTKLITNLSLLDHLYKFPLDLLILFVNLIQLPILEIIGVQVKRYGWINFNYLYFCIDLIPTLIQIVVSNIRLVLSKLFLEYLWSYLLGHVFEE